MNKQAPNAVLKKIKANAHWRVNFRPTQFSANHISSVSECWDIAEKARVELRGWDYPHVSTHEHERLTDNDWVGSFCDFWGHQEYWRLYQSGQFIHLFSFWEDQEEDLMAKARHWIPMAKDKEFSGVLNVQGANYTCTEITEFLSRLTQKGIYKDGVQVSVELVGAKDRVLYASPPAHLFAFYRCSTEKISWNKVFAADAVLAGSQEIAIELLVYIFERFSWKDVPANAFADEQAKYLGRRLAR